MAGRVQNAYAIDKEARGRGGDVLERSSAWLGELDNATRGFPCHETSITHDSGVLAVEALDEHRCPAGNIEIDGWISPANHRDITSGKRFGGIILRFETMEQI